MRCCVDQSTVTSWYSVTCPTPLWERRTRHSPTFPGPRTALPSRCNCYPPCCAEFMWLLRFKSRCILFFFSVSAHQNKHNNSMLARINCHLHCADPTVPADRSAPKEEVSHTADNAYHPCVSHVGFTWHLAANPMQPHTCCSFTLIGVVRMNRSETLRFPRLSRETAIRVDTDSWSAIHCS